MTPAQICRKRGWKPYTIIEVEREEGAARFLITAISQNNVLGKQVGSKNWGFSWTEHNTFEQSLPFRLILDSKRVYSYTGD